MKQKKRHVFQSALSEEEAKMFKEVADHKNKAMSVVFREWLRKSHSQIHKGKAA